MVHCGAVWVVIMVHCCAVLVVILMHCGAVWVYFDTLWCFVGGDS